MKLHGSVFISFKIGKVIASFLCRRVDVHSVREGMDWFLSIVLTAKLLLAGSISFQSPQKAKQSQVRRKRQHSPGLISLWQQSTEHTTASIDTNRLTAEVAYRLQ